MAETERHFYEEVTKAVTSYAIGARVNERFLLASPLRLLTSSPAAASEYWSGQTGPSADDMEENDDDLAIQDFDDRPLVSRLETLCKTLNLTEALRTHDTKFNGLFQHLQKFWAEFPDDKVIIFSAFKPTLRYLSDRFESDGISHEVLHGSVKESREAILERFASDMSKRLLLSSEVGSEGVDLQFCWVVVNYDLPWNPMKVEQRIGRVDRLGQSKEKVSIVNLLYDETIDAKIYFRLFERLKLTENALGSFEAVLGDPIRDMERKLLDPELTDEQKLEVVDQAAQAAENMKVEHDRLEDEAGALIQHGDYVMEKIYETRALQRWLSDVDVLVFVKSGLDEFFPGCILEEAPVGSNEYRIVLSTDARDSLATFIAKKGIKSGKAILQNSAKRRYMFTASVVSADASKTESISQMHPVVRFIVDKQLNDGEHSNPEPVAAKLSIQDSDISCDVGDYVIAIMQWDINAQGETKTGHSKMAHAGADMETGRLISSELAETITGKVASFGRNLINLANDKRLPRAAETLSHVIYPHLDRMFADYVERANANVEDRAEIRVRALARHREGKLSNLREQRQNFLLRASNSNALGEERAAQRFRALASGTETRMNNLTSAIDVRLRQIDQQRDTIPELTEVACLFVEVTP
jgi:hypothetical protein